MEEGLTPTKKTLIGDLMIKGRDSTKKLQNLLRRRTIDDGSMSVSAEDLVTEILGSFSDSLSVLSSWGSGEFPATTYVGSTCSDDRTWDSIESEKKPSPVVKDRRGCYKRRKTEDSRVKIADTIDDGYAWRKYGQKEILNAKNPRCYFRCTHKGEGCKALKQVQKLEDGSEMFHITYFGYHTCQNMYKNTNMLSDTQALNFYLHNFEDTNIKHSPSSLSTITNTQFTPSVDQEDVSNAQSDDHHYGKESNALWKDIIGNLEPSHDDFFKDSVSLYDFKFD